MYYEIFRKTRNFTVELAATKMSSLRWELARWVERCLTPCSKWPHITVTSVAAIGHRLPTPCSGKSGIQIVDLLSSWLEGSLKIAVTDFTMMGATERKPRYIDGKLVPGNACFSGGLMAW